MVFSSTFLRKKIELLWRDCVRLRWLSFCVSDFLKDYRRYPFETQHTCTMWWPTSTDKRRQHYPAFNKSYSPFPTRISPKKYQFLKHCQRHSLKSEQSFTITRSIHIDKKGNLVIISARVICHFSVTSTWSTILGCTDKSQVHGFTTILLAWLFVLATASVLKLSKMSNPPNYRIVIKKDDPVFDFSDISLR